MNESIDIFIKITSNSVHKSIIYAENKNKNRLKRRYYVRRLKLLSHHIVDLSCMRRTSLMDPGNNNIGRIYLHIHLTPGGSSLDNPSRQKLILVPFYPVPAILTCDKRPDRTAQFFQRTSNNKKTVQEFPNDLFACIPAQFSVSRHRVDATSRTTPTKATKRGEPRRSSAAAC